MPAAPEPKGDAPIADLALSQPQRDRVAAASAPLEVTAGSDGLVIVRVVRSDDGTPIAGQRVTVVSERGRFHDGAYADGGLPSFGDELSTDEEGVCRFRVATGVRTRALPLPVFGLKGAFIGPLAPGETREVVLTVPVFDHWVQVEAASNGSRVAGASVRVEGTDREVTTDENGLAKLWSLRWGRETATVQIAGCAPALLHLRPGHERPEEALVVTLSRRGSVRGRVVDEADQPVAGTRVELREFGDDAPFGESAASVAFDQRGWLTITDASGAFSFRDVPASVPLQVRIVKSFELYPHPPPAIVLAPDEEREIVYKRGGGATLRGQVRTESGDAAELCMLLLTPVAAQGPALASSSSLLAGGSNRRPGSVRRSSSPSRSVRCDKAGAFELKGVPSGEFTLQVERHSVYHGSPVVVQVPEGAQLVDIQVEVQRGFHIEGRVLLPDGSPAEGIRVLSDRGPSTETFRRDECASPGYFALGPFKEGEVTLDVESSNAGYLAAPLRVEAGARDVVLQLSERSP